MIITYNIIWISRWRIKPVQKLAVVSWAPGLEKSSQRSVGMGGRACAFIALSHPGCGNVTGYEQGHRVPLT